MIHKSAKKMPQQCKFNLQFICGPYAKNDGNLNKIIKVPKILHKVTTNSNDSDDFGTIDYHRHYWGVECFKPSPNSCSD